MHVNDLLKIAALHGASDLHIKAGSYPVMRLRGELVNISEDQRLTHEDVVTMTATVMSRLHTEKFKDAQEVDLAYGVAGLGRFRVNVFQQRGSIGMVLRVIPTQIKGIDDLNLPPSLKKIAGEERGLVLVTGTTGSGKSTTLAAMARLRSAGGFVSFDPNNVTSANSHPARSPLSLPPRTAAITLAGPRD